MREQDILRFLADLSSSQEFDDNLLIDHELIEQCKDIIKKNITTLKDIPIELGNTIANIYYKLCLLTRVDIRSAGWFPNKEDYLDNTINFMKNYNKLKADLHSIPDFVNWLREIDRVNEPELYDYFVEYVIDCLKYDIENINFKDIYERRSERKIKQEHIREIKYLVHMLDV